MTMLDIFKERMPQGMEIVKVKERNNYYHLLVSYQGTTAEAHLGKAVAPGYAEKNCDFTICATMAGIGFDTGNVAMAKEWLEKQSRVMTQKIPLF